MSHFPYSAWDLRTIPIFCANNKQPSHAELLQSLSPFAETFPAHLEEWISGMLAGASSLKHACLHGQLLQYLPTSTRQALKSLRLRSIPTPAMPDVVQALLECQHLEELTIICLRCDLEIPVLVPAAPGASEEVRVSPLACSWQSAPFKRAGVPR